MGSYPKHIDDQAKFWERKAYAFPFTAAIVVPARSESAPSVLPVSAAAAARPQAVRLSRSLRHKLALPKVH